MESPGEEKLRAFKEVVVGKRRLARDRNRSMHSGSGATTALVHATSGYRVWLIAYRGGVGVPHV